MKFILFVTTLFALLFIIATSALAVEESALMAEMNATRANHGKVGLVSNHLLEQAADLKLADMQAYKYWSHNNPVTRTYWTRFARSVGYYRHIGENLANNYGSEAAVVGAWMGSYSHRVNLLNGYINEAGIAIGQVELDGVQKEVVVVQFGAGRRQ
jgi:uncharacterized protein YkwD